MIRDIGNNRIELTVGDWSEGQVALLLALAHLPAPAGTPDDDFPVAIDKIGREMPAWVVYRLAMLVRDLETRPDGPALWQLAHRVLRVQGEFRRLVGGRRRCPLRRPVS